LQVRTNEIMEKVLVQALSMVPGPRQPADNGTFVMLEDPAGGSHIHALTGGGHDFIHPPHRRSGTLDHRRYW
jgi:hypothetical protein